VEFAYDIGAFGGGDFENASLGVVASPGQFRQPNTNSIGHAQVGHQHRQDGFASDELVSGLTFVGKVGKVPGEERNGMVGGEFCDLRGSFHIRRSINDVLRLYKRLEGVRDLIDFALDGLHVAEPNILARVLVLYRIRLQRPRQHSFASSPQLLLQPCEQSKR